MMSGKKDTYQNIVSPLGIFGGLANGLLSAKGIVIQLWHALNVASGLAYRTTASSQSECGGSVARYVVR